jgi:predicted DNA-binding transcriptional regulator AlpA
MRKQRTAREIAEKCGLSIRTVQRHISRPRAEYLANSLSRSKPWEALGVSRATWYRMGKPTEAKAA